MRTFLILTAFIAALAISQSTAIPTLAADEYDDVKSAQSKNLKSKDENERASAVESICRTGDARAADLAISMMMKEENPFAAQRMGAALQYLKTDAALDDIADKTRKMTGINKAFPALWALTGVAIAQTEKGDKLIEELILDSKDRQVYIKTAALEAIAVAGRTLFWEPVEKVLRTKEKDWEDNPIVIITACTVAARIFDARSAFKLVDALADTIDNYENERIKRFAAGTCGTISNSKAYLDSKWWRHWAKAEGKVGEEAEKERDASSTSVRRKPPEFFGVEAVGNRICFIIDNSGSMATPVTVPPQPKQEEPKEKKGPISGGGSKKDKEDKDKKDEVPPPDYSKVKTKLDLAKVELIYTLEQLDKDFDFNVVIYSTAHKYLIQSTLGFVEANDGNKKRFITAIKKLQTEGATNIHGALVRGFQTTKGSPIKGDPALDKEGFMSGAETIFFLTDGFACYCDGSTAQDASGFGNGPFATGAKLLPDIVRINTFRKVVINTIGIGPHDKTLLPALARSSGGTYRDLSGQ